MLAVVLLVIVLVVAGYFVMTYNFFVSTKARIKASVQEIGNQLKRQADLIPNLESSAKGYLKQEKDIFKMLTNARKAVAGAVESGDVQKMADAGSQVANLLPQLNIAVEDNPELKSNEVVAKLMDELRDTADKIMYSRRLLIDLSADYNVKRVTFPSNIVANMFGFKEEAGLAVEGSEDATKVGKEELKTPKIDL